MYDRARLQKDFYVKSVYNTFKIYSASEPPTDFDKPQVHDWIHSGGDTKFPVRAVSNAGLVHTKDSLLAKFSAQNLVSN